MGASLSSSQSAANSQQGFILALSLLMMLFVSAVVVSSINFTGVQARVAQSAMMEPTIRSAAEQGFFTLREVGSAATGANLSSACQSYFAAILPSDAYSYMDENGVQVWWRLDEARSAGDSDCAALLDGQPLSLVVTAWQGTEDGSNIIALQRLGLNVMFENVPPDGSDGDLINTFGNDAARTLGEFRVSAGSAHVYGAAGFGVGVGSHWNSLSRNTDFSPSDLGSDPLKAAQNLTASGIASIAASVLPSGNHTINAATLPTRTVFDREMKVMHLSSLDTGNVTISGGDVVLYVAGDVDIGNITIMPGSSLTLIADGRLNFKGSSVTDSGSMSDSGWPSFVGISFHENSAATSNGNNNNAAIKLQAGSNMRGLLYAPSGEFDLRGNAHHTGQAFAKQIVMSGNSSFTHTQDYAPVGQFRPRTDIDLDYDYY
ncbi:DUF7305 domain-containing protein [Marinospirillum alkaliphilum]|uniref:DUF7305 domain-containing protein n=1 Tax=Marinospirillum alkaliphilum DSM 21637 TaxID=1122209 RepID=A0A1K1ZZC9_9GAMM|nr:hypothetical protein [Marinospirillum alkaliphilum]SFX79432.1 hypothetical protein SAMN02745752_02896 [Marinospirillum alkaliphilum DSM 21637]